MENRLKMILAIVNNKGGVGKTTTVQNLAAGMLRKDKKLRILEIDLDPQCNLTLLNHAPEGCATVFDSLIACKGLPIYKSEIGVYYVPGSAKCRMWILSFRIPDLLVKCWELASAVLA